MSETIRRVTYPPDFRYVEHHEVTSAMWQLARDVRALKGLLGGADGLSPESHREVIRLLHDMEATAGKIDPKGRRSTHPRIDQNIGAFRRDLAMARQAAERDPPELLFGRQCLGLVQLLSRGTTRRRLGGLQD